MKTDKNNQASKITKEYLENRYSAATEEKIQKWLIEDENSEEKEQASLEYWDALEPQLNPEAYEALKRVNEKAGVNKIIPLHHRLHRRMMRIAAVIIPALFILGGVYYFSQRENIVQVMAENGETKHIVLPDNSEVWLNVGSSIQYTSKFGNEKRSVTLDGEAWFSVQKDKAKPFIVSTNHLSVTVLGTEFNVKAYSNESKTIATLATGKIEVQTNANQIRVLEPNDQLVFDNQTANISVTTVSPNDASSWKTGQLIFTDATFGEIVQTLERRFDVTIQADRSIEKSGELYTIKFLKNDSIEQILNVLKDVSGGFSYRKSKNQIEIKSIK